MAKFITKFMIKLSALNRSSDILKALNQWVWTKALHGY